MPLIQPPALSCAPPWILHALRKVFTGSVTLRLAHPPVWRHCRISQAHSLKGSWGIRGLASRLALYETSPEPGMTNARLGQQPTLSVGILSSDIYPNAQEPDVYRSHHLQQQY